MKSSTQSLVILFFSLSLFAIIGFHDNFWSPFLPTEFTDRGLSDSTTGIIIASYDVACLSTPVLIFVTKNIKLNKHTFSMSALSQGFFSVILGVLIFIESNVSFVILCITTRFLMGIANALLWCSGTKIFLSLFPDDPGKVFGAIPGSVSIGIVLGTPYGSFFYGIGGYCLPFVIVGCCEMVLALITFIVLSMKPKKFLGKKDFTLEEKKCDGHQQNFYRHVQQMKKVSLWSSS